MKTHKLLGLLCAAGFAATALGHAAPAHALSFDFEFDNTDDGTVTPPIGAYQERSPLGVLI